MSAALANADWWKGLSVSGSELEQRIQQSARAVSFRIGDYRLQVFTDYQPLLLELEETYGDCGVSEIEETTATIRCIASLIPASSLLSMSFDGPNLLDPFEIVHRLFNLLRHRQCFVERAGPSSGLRLLVNTEEDDRILAACYAQTLIVDLEQAPPEFVLDCITGMVQTAQPQVLFIHAAVVGVGGAGALLVGSSHRGKSTTALAMAQRGCAFLGDDIAAVRLNALEVVPFLRSAGLREGSFAREIENDVRRCGFRLATGPDGVERRLVRVAKLFPQSRSAPLPLRCAFFLDGFSERISFGEFEPELNDMQRLRSLVSEATPFWGNSPGRDLLRFLSVLNMLKRLRCFMVKLGTPQESAIAIEEMMAACI